MSSRNERLRIAEHVEAEIPDVKFTRNSYGVNMGGACPWQAEGTYQGQPFYVRFRHNQASMTVFDGDEPFEGESVFCSVVYPYDAVDCDNLDGWLAEDEVLPFMRTVVDALAPVSEENPTGEMLMGRAIKRLMQAMGVDSSGDEADHD